MILPLLALLGIVAFASSRARAAAPSAPRPSSSTKAPPTSKEVAARIVQETKEIIDGKRDAYTDDEATVDAELERARRAVALAQQKEAKTPPPASSSAPRPSTPAKMTVGPVVQKQAAAPAARKPAPAGTDLALAKQTAAQVAAHLKQKGRDGYDRKVLKLWQTRAGLPPDGIYGRGTAAALKYFGAAAPAAFFAQGTASYTPPA